MKLRVAPTLHPSHIQRGAWEKIYYLVEDIRKAHAQAWKPALSVLPTRYVPHPTVEQARGVLRLGDRRPMVLDIETRGTEDNAEIVCCGVGRAEREAVCLPWREPFKGLLRSALMDPSSMKVAHNMGFDFPRLERGLGLGEIKGAKFDTLEAWNLCQPDLDKGLDELGSMVYDQHPWKGDTRDTLEVYNCRDIDVTGRAREWLEREMGVLGVDGLFRRTVMPALDVLIRMRERGMHVDLGRQARAVEELRPVLERARGVLNELVAALPARMEAIDGARREADRLDEEALAIDRERGKKSGQRSREGNKLRAKAKGARKLAAALMEVNPDSPLQVKRLLYEELGFEPRTRKGRDGKESVSTDDDALIELWRQHRHPIIPPIRELRELGKLLGTYLSFEEETIHPRLLLWGTATGRLSCRDPNMQNIPKRGQYAKMIRRVFTPRHPGWVFTSADYSQIERRLQALLWKDGDLQAAFDKGLDCHRDAASRIFGVPYDAVSDIQRTMAKGAVYGQSYGMGYLKFHRLLASMEIEVEVVEAKRLLQAIRDAYPGVARGADLTVAEAEREHVLRNEFGRLRWFFGSPHGDAMNFPFQSDVADIMLIAMVKVDEQLPAPSMLIMQVHDELLVEHPVEQTRLVRECLMDNMGAEVKELGGWKCPVETKTSGDWSHQELWEEGK